MSVPMHAEREFGLPAPFTDKQNKDDGDGESFHGSANYFGFSCSPSSMILPDP